MPSPDPLLDLIRRVRLRWMFAHACRLFVIAALVSAVALGVAAVVLRAVPTAIAPLHAGVAVIAVIVGVIIVGTFRRWPSDARVAVHIDAALELRELLASGLASTGEDEGSRLVRGSATEVARRTCVRDIPERFPSAHSLLAAVLFLAAAMAVNGLVQLEASSESQHAGSGSTFDPNGRDPVSGHDPRAMESSKGTSSARDLADEGEDASRIVDHASSASSSSSAASGGDGSSVEADGGQRGETKEASRDRLVEATAGKPSLPGGENAEAIGGGGGLPGESGNGQADRRSGTSLPRVPMKDITGLEASGANEAADQSGTAVARIPDRHRALIRAYFDADRPSAATHPSTAR